MSKFFGENAGKQLIRELFNATGTALQGKADLVNGKVPAGQIPGVSWNNLTDKPFDDVESFPAYSYAISEPATGGMVVADELGGTHTLYCVGDAVPLDVLIGATATVESTSANGQTVIEQITITSDRAVSYDGYGVVQDEKFYIVSTPDDDWSMDQFTGSEAGLYFGTFDAYDTDGVETTYKLTHVYKTSSAITFPSDTSGVESIAAGDGLTFYRVGAVVTTDDLVGASYTLRVEQNGSITTETSSITSSMVSGEEAYLMVFPSGVDAPMIIVVLSDNTIINGISVSRSGTYFATLQANDNQTVTMQSVSIQSGVDATLPLDTTKFAQSVSNDSGAKRMKIHRVGDALSMEQLAGATLTTSLLADGTVTNNTTILEYGQNMDWLDNSTQDAIIMGDESGAISVLKTVTELTQEPLSPGLYLTEIVSRSKATTPSTSQRIVVSLARDAQYTTQRLSAKYVEADWNHMINLPFYEETIPAIDLQQPDYATADSISFDIDYANMATMPAKAVRISDYYTPTQLSGAVCTMMFSDESDDRVVDGYLVTADHWYGMFRDGIPWFLVTDTDDVTVSISDSNASTFSVALPTAGIYFLYADASAMQEGLFLRTVSLEKDAQTIVHQIERKYVPIPDIEIPDPMPAVTAADDGKFMVVENGVWTAQAVPSAEAMVF